jgi:hypothetical protein
MNRIPKDKSQKRDLKVVNVSCFHAPSLLVILLIIIQNSFETADEGNPHEGDKIALHMVSSRKDEKGQDITIYHSVWLSFFSFHNSSLSCFCTCHSCDKSCLDRKHRILRLMVSISLSTSLKQSSRDLTRNQRRIQTICQ